VEGDDAVEMNRRKFLNACATTIVAAGCARISPDRGAAASGGVPLSGKNRDRPKSPPRGPGPTMRDPPSAFPTTTATRANSTRRFPTWRPRGSAGPSTCTLPGAICRRASPNGGRRTSGATRWATTRFRHAGRGEPYMKANGRLPDWLPLPLERFTPQMIADEVAAAADWLDKKHRA